MQNTVKPGDSKPVDSKQPGVSKLFTAYQPIYNINLQIDSKLLPIFERSETWPISKQKYRKSTRVTI